MFVAPDLDNIMELKHSEVYLLLPHLVADY